MDGFHLPQGTRDLGKHLGMFSGEAAAPWAFALRSPPGVTPGLPGPPALVPIDSFLWESQGRVSRWQAPAVAEHTGALPLVFSHIPTGQSGSQGSGPWSGDSTFAMAFPC